MLDAAKEEGSSKPPTLPGQTRALWAWLCLVVAFCLAGTRAEAFFAEHHPAPGQIAAFHSEATGQNYDGSQYDALDSLIAAKSAPGVSYRLGSPVAEIPRYEFAMMSHEQRIAAVVEKYGINLRGRQVVFDPKLGTGQLGMTAQANPMVMRVGSGVMNSETELAATIAHELRHSRAYMGSGLNTEAAAEASEGALRSFIQGGR